MTPIASSSENAIADNFEKISQENWLPKDMLETVLPPLMALIVPTINDQYTLFLTGGGGVKISPEREVTSLGEALAEFNVRVLPNVKPIVKSELAFQLNNVLGKSHLPMDDNVRTVVRRILWKFWPHWSNEPVTAVRLETCLANVMRIPNIDSQLIINDWKKQAVLIKSAISAQFQQLKADWFNESPDNGHIRVTDIAGELFNHPWKTSKLFIDKMLVALLHAAYFVDKTAILYGFKLVMQAMVYELDDSGTHPEVPDTLFRGPDVIPNCVNFVGVLAPFNNNHERTLVYLALSSLSGGKLRYRDAELLRLLKVVMAYALDSSTSITRIHTIVNQFTKGTPKIKKTTTIHEWLQMTNAIATAAITQIGILHDQWMAKPASNHG